MAEIAGAAGAALGIAGTVVSGAQKKKAGKEESQQLLREAGQERASSQRDAIEERRQARLAISRGLAVAAASGAGASDPTVINRLADLHAEGEYNALVAMFEGYTKADDLTDKAAAARKAGKRAFTSSLISAGSQTLSMAAKYG